MEPQQKRVLEFHRAFGQPAPEHFSPLRDAVLLQLRAKLILEEALEFCTAAGLAPVLRIDDHDEDILINKISLAEARVSPSDIDMIDALCDLSYVTYGTAVTMGLDLEQFECEVHRSNMSKLGPDGRPILRNDGKVLKGPGFSLPDIGLLLEREIELRYSAAKHFKNCGPFCEHTKICSVCTEARGLCIAHKDDPNGSIEWH